MAKDTAYVPVYQPQESGYRNPLYRGDKTPDPCIVYCTHNHCYYGVHTHDFRVLLYRSETLSGMFCGEPKVVYEPNEADKTYGSFWAPELHFIDGRWYIYTSTHQTADNRGFKHVLCLAAKTDDPMDGFELGGHLNPEVFGIDPTVYQNKRTGKLYLCFSLVDDGDKATFGKQRLALQEMRSPTAVTGDYTVIAEATYDWETVPPYCGKSTINEGAYFIESGDRLFIVYSGNGCWSDDYVLGLIEYTGGDFLSPDAWVKNSVPFMVKGNGNYGPGHATFFYSPDGTELWICHHCLAHSDPENVEIPRYCHCQKVFFDKTGLPLVGMPVPPDVFFRPPAGE